VSFYSSSLLLLLVSEAEPSRRSVDAPVAAIAVVLLRAPPPERFLHVRRARKLA
jgi:hypothetical protein